MLKLLKDRVFELNKTDRILYLIFFVFFISYLSTLQFRPYPLSEVVKIIPIISLSFIAFRSIPGKSGKIVFAGLLFSAVGDYFLALSGRKFFVVGLSAFGAAHIMYIIAFIRNPELKKNKIYLVSAFIIYGYIIRSLLIPNLGEMVLPVTIYITLLTLMGISSVLGKNNHRIIIVGAFLFVISDSIIAINTYLTKVPNSSFWIMLTYFPAQFFITYGACKPKYINRGK